MKKENHFLLLQSAQVGKAAIFFIPKFRFREEYLLFKTVVFVSVESVIKKYNDIKKLKTENIESRGWLLDVLNCVNSIKDEEFTLQDIYRFSETLRKKHLSNNNIEAKIRQQLQLLRDKGFIEFLDRGHYRKIIS